MALMILTKTSDIMELKPEWESLLNQLNNTNPFCSAEFALSWWKTHPQGKLHIIVSRDKQKNLRAILPMYLTENDEMCSLADREVSDYYEWLIDPNQSEEVLHEFGEFLRKSTVKSVNILSVPENSKTRKYFQQLGTLLKKKVTETEQDVCPVIELPETWDEYLAQIGKKQRHEIKRKTKKLTEALQPKFELVKSVKNLDKAIDDFIRLHKLSGEEKASFWTATTEAYFRQVTQSAAEKGWLKLFFLKVHSQRVATMLCFDDTHTYYLYNSGFDPAQFAGLSVGNVLTAYTIRHAIEAGRKQYNFLRGDEEYKFRFGATQQPIFDLNLDYYDIIIG